MRPRSGVKVLLETGPDLELATERLIEHAYRALVGSVALCSRRRKRRGWRPPCAAMAPDRRRAVKISKNGGKFDWHSERMARVEPEESVLYRVVSAYWPSFRERIEGIGRLPKFVAREVDEYLRCGLLEYGFLRVQCTDCGFERLVGFSCTARSSVALGCALGYENRAMMQGGVGASMAKSLGCSS